MIKKIGHYFNFIGDMFRHRESIGLYPPLILDEMMRIGISSIFIVSIVSTFIGAVTAVQTAYNMVSPLIPKYIIGTIVRDMTLLELAPTFTCVVLAGKVGSNIAGGLGTMRITEQIDALEVMGVNSVSYLVLPKIVAALIMFPCLVILAAFLAFLGGFIASVATGAVTQQEYIYGIRYQFIPYNLTFALIKAVVFAFLISTISAYKGYFTRGGALEVGQASTQAVTSSCIAVLVADFLLAQLLL